MTGPHASRAAPKDKEINLAEFTRAVLAGRWIALLFMVLCIGLALFYASNAQKKYRSSSIFELTKSNSAPKLPAELASLSGLAGLSMGGQEDKGVFDRLAGRDFIRNIAQDLDLANDPDFNPPVKPRRAISFTSLQLMLGLVSEAQLVPDPDERIAVAYRKAVSVSETPNGSIEISVLHTDPERAAQIANSIVSRLLRALGDEKRAEQQGQLAYLSDQLADSLTQMEVTKRAVADFALANSLASPQAFATRSQAMFELREDLRGVEAMAQAVERLTAIMARDEAPGLAEYQALRATTPIIDDVDFRRLIGVPEELDAWVWPPRTRLGDFASTLRDRSARIARGIADLTNDAERYAASTEQLAVLKRESQVAEATYNVLIEQVKAQAIMSGYQGDIAKIYQIARPSKKPAKPNALMVLILGITTGLMGGIALAAIFSTRRGRVFSASKIAGLAPAPLNISAPQLGRVRVRSVQSLEAHLDKITSLDLSSLVVAHTNDARKLSMLISTAPSLRAFPAALWLGKRSAAQGARTAILSIAETLPRDLEFTNHPDIPALARASLGEVTILRARTPGMEENVLTSPAVHLLLSEKSADFDRIILATASAQAVTTTRAFAGFAPFMILLSKPGQSLAALLKTIVAIAPPDAVIRLSR